MAKYSSETLLVVPGYYRCWKTQRPEGKDGIFAEHSSGLPGAAPTKTVLLPAQGLDQAIWHTRGRDTPREQHALTMVEGVWTYSGDGKVGPPGANVGNLRLARTTA